MKEIKNLKAVAQMILDQRSDVEEYFLEAVDIVKEELKKKSSQDLLKQPSRYTETLSKGKADSRGRFSSDKLDYNNLPWEEKEKILRILFAKMNSGIPPSNWRTHYSVMNPNYQKGTLEDEGSPDYNPRPYFSTDNEH